MTDKARVSIEWLSGCSGCEMAIVDLHDKLLTVLGELKLVRCPILMDTKDYVEAEIGLITGSLRTDHDIHAAKKMRKACRTIVAFGTCPVYGGPQGACYPHSTEELVRNSFVTNASTRSSAPPQNVPALLDGNRPLDAEIDVDLYIPGCPPHPSFILEALMALLRGREPKIGRHNVCHGCNRTMAKTDVAKLRRTFEGDYDPKVCFLSQGCLCLGSATLDRCLAPCPQHGVPCFGCAGPSEAIILEPQKDLRTEVASRMASLTKIPYEEVVRSIERQSKTIYAYAMASPVFRQKPTFLIKKWLKAERTA